MVQNGIATARVLEDGRITVPKPVREQLELAKGDIVRINVESLEGGR
jgi:AbrB family looped-hinge helix DNA binding protein